MARVAAVVFARAVTLALVAAVAAVPILTRVTSAGHVRAGATFVDQQTTAKHWRHEEESRQECPSRQSLYALHAPRTRDIGKGYILSPRGHAKRLRGGRETNGLGSGAVGARVGICRRQRDESRLMAKGAKAWQTGINWIELMLTCAGRETAHSTASTTSSGDSGVVPA